MLSYTDQHSSMLVLSAQSEEERTVTLQVDGEESTLEFLQSEDFQVSAWSQIN